MGKGNPGKSLNTYVTWHEVFRLLGIDVQVLVLPTTVSCPHCRQDALHVYQDNTSGGAWHYCSACKFTGDTLELAASVWDQDIPTTVLKLNAHGISFPDDALDPSIIDRYTQRHVEYRKGMRALWALSQDRLPKKDTPAISKLHDMFTEGHSATSVTWTKRGKNFLGGCHVDDVYRAFRRESVRNAGRPLTHKELNAGHNRVFQGRGWSDVIMFPHYELPGKIKGFTFIGREGTSQDTLYRRVVTNIGVPLGSDSSMCDPGLSMYETMFLYHPKYKSKTFIVNDPVIAMRLQLRHLRQHNIPLPICGSHSDSNLVNRHMWGAMFPREFIFWGPELTAALIQQAQRANGKIALSKGLSALTTKLTSKTPERWIDLMASMAKPWQDVLIKELQDASLPVAESLLLRLRLPPQDMRDLAAKAPQDLKVKLEDVFNTASQEVRTASVEGSNLVEDETGWHLASNGRIVSDAVIRIDKVIYQPASDDSYYKGTITRKGKQIEFTDNVELVEQAPVKWLRNKLIAAGMGRPQVSAHWARHLLTVSQTFHDPESVVGVDSFGWSAEQQAFLFPHFTIRRDGEVCTEQVMHVVGKYSPAVALRPPKPLTHHQVTALKTPNEYMGVFWATTACITANILAPALNLPKTGLALLGTGATVAGRAAARALGCVDITIAQKTMESTLRALQEANDAHSWPIVLKKYSPNIQRTFKAWLNDPEEKNCIAEVNCYQAQALIINGGWNVIECRSPEVAMQTILEAGSHVLPAFLQYLCQQRLHLDRSKGLAQGVLEELSVWFEKQGGPDIRLYSSLLYTGEVFGPENSIRKNLLNIIFQLFTEQRLKLVMAGFNEDGKSNRAIQHNNNIYIPQAAVLSLINKKGAPGLDIHRLEQEFNVYSVDGALYWSIPEEEWVATLNERKPSSIIEVL